MVRKLCSIFFIKQKKIDASRPTVGKFRSKLNYAAEAMLNFFFIKTKQKLEFSTVAKFSSKLNYHA